MRDKFKSLIGGFSSKFEVVSDTKVSSNEKISIHRVVLRNDKGEIPSLVGVPKKLGKKAAILCPHQHNLQFEKGKSEVFGLPVNGTDYNKINNSIPLGKELAERGYITISPDMICFEERFRKGNYNPFPEDSSQDGVWYERFVAMEELLKGKSMTHRMLYDLSTALNYLTSRKDVDSERIGCVGHSMGGMQTLYLAAIDERIKAAVISGALSTFESIIKNQINHCFFPYLPGLLEKGIDMGDILGMIAPRPVLVISAKYDEWMPIKGAKEAYQKAKKIYGNNELEMLVTEGKHGFDRDVWNKAYSWISSKLI